MRLDPPVPTNTYHDSFGNFCHVIRAPAGRLTMSSDFLVQDDGRPDPIAAEAEQHALEDLPVEVLTICSAAVTARPIAYRICQGRFSVRFRGVGRWRGRSVTMSTIASRSITSMRARQEQRGTQIQSNAACAATSPISLSHYAAA